MVRHIEALRASVYREQSRNPDFIDEYKALLAEHEIEFDEWYLL